MVLTKSEVVVAVGVYVHDYNSSDDSVKKLITICGGVGNDSWWW